MSKKTAVVDDTSGERNKISLGTRLSSRDTARKDAPLCPPSGFDSGGRVRQDQRQNHSHVVGAAWKIQLEHTPGQLRSARLVELARTERNQTNISKTGSDALI